MDFPEELTNPDLLGALVQVRVRRANSLAEGDTADAYAADHCTSGYSAPVLFFFYIIYVTNDLSKTINTDPQFTLSDTIRCRRLLQVSVVVN